MRPATRDLVLYGACAVGIVGIILHRSLVPAPPYAPKASPEALAAFARSTLEGVQRTSIADRREHCGVIIESDAGELSASPIYDGERAQCAFLRMREPGSHVVASFHTHGGADPDYDSEYPSEIDLEGDIAERIAGFIATPGGRIWRTDWRAGRATMLCGEGCVTPDPAYDPAAGETPRGSYTLDELRRRFAPLQL